MLDDLEEIERFRRSVPICPKCRSNEGFWLTSNRERSYVQCKHCGAILEICEFFPPTAESQTSKGILRKLKF
jgi:ribosomal protein L37AE/L43A